MSKSIRSRILSTYPERDQYVIWDLIEMLSAEKPEAVASFLANPYEDDE